jgi:hypothetical protein
MNNTNWLSQCHKPRRLGPISEFIGRTVNWYSYFRIWSGCIDDNRWMPTTKSDYSLQVSNKEWPTVFLPAFTLQAPWWNVCFYVTDMKYTILLRQPQVQNSSDLKGFRKTEQLGFSLRDKSKARQLINVLADYNWPKLYPNFNCAGLLTWFEKVTEERKQNILFLFSLSLSHTHIHTHIRKHAHTVWEETVRKVWLIPDTPL